MTTKQNRTSPYKSFTVALCFLLTAIFTLPTSQALGIDATQLLNEAETGDMNAAYFIGVMYRTGSGMPQNCREALKWTKQAAEEGHALAQSHLGTLYTEGCNEEVIPEDYLAYFWTALAAQQGVEFAQLRLAELESRLHPYLVAEAKRKMEEFKSSNVN